MREFKLPNSAAYKISVTGTSAKLLDLINTAAGTTILFPHDLSVVFLTPEDGDVRFTTNGTVPTAANGTIVTNDFTDPIECSPVDMQLISVTGTVVCNVRLGYHHRNNLS